jgi:hypothetical protein
MNNVSQILLCASQAEIMYLFEISRAELLYNTNKNLYESASVNFILYLETHIIYWILTYLLPPVLHAFRYGIL